MQDAFIQSCPIEPSHSSINSEIHLPEGFLKRCLDCGQLFSSCTFQQYNETMKEFNVQEGTSPSTENAPRRFLVHKKRLEKAQEFIGKTSKNTRLLDIGCSSGSFLSSASRLGYQVEGLDPAPEAARTAQMAGFRVHVGFVEDLAIPKGSFDLITIFEVIEHLSNPKSMLMHCHELLNNEGYLMISTGNGISWSARALKGAWEYFSMRQHGGHVSFFNPSSIKLLAETTGFTVVKVETRGLRLLDKEHSSVWGYRFAKILAELLSITAKLCGRGHDMLVILKKEVA